MRKRLPQKISLVEIDKKESQRLSRIYRGKNKPRTFSLHEFFRAERSTKKVRGKPANVLSFRYGPDYGEILVCPEVIRREAKKQGNSYKYQMTWMILHGMMHLAGLHHERSLKMAKRVMALEERVLRKLFS